MRRAPLQWIPRSAPGRRRGFATAALAPADEPIWPAHDPRLAPRDEIIFLLHTAAEVEHALMVQYLFAGWSAMFDETRWSSTIRLVAKQEMGHLVTVENVLRSLRGPLNFEREDYPFRTALYPFHFALEPLSRGSLAKYVIAEMPKNPLTLPLDPPLTAADLDDIRRDAHLGNMKEMVNRVGDLYEHVQFLIAEHLSDLDFSPATAGFQADPEDWHADFVEGMIIEKITNKAEALSALRKIAEQGEGVGETGGEDLLKTHFYLFLKIYRERLAQGDGPDVPVRDLPTDPSTSAQTSADSEIELNRISHPVARHLAQLFNLRYRILLVDLAHALSIESDLLPKDPAAPNDPQKPSGRAELREWTFEEMRRMPDLARSLVSLPRRDGLDVGPPFAAPPFELPYTLALPDQELDRWLLQGDLIENGRQLIELTREELGRSGLSEDMKRQVERLLRAVEKAETTPGDPLSRQEVVRSHIARLQAHC